MARLTPFIILVAAFVLAALPAHSVRAQSDGSDVLDDIRQSIAMGDVERLIDLASERVDLTVLGTSELLSRSQARYVIRSFFAVHPPTRIVVADTSEDDGNLFVFAEYWYETGTEPLAVYLRLRQGSGGWKLRELRFDRSSNR